MGISERRERQLAEVRAAILKQSWQIVEEEGWEALSIRKIADAIEYSTPVVYKHFENKDAILEAFSQAGYAMMADSLHQAQAKHTTPSDQLRAIADAYWQFAHQHPRHYQIMYGLGMPPCEQVHQITELKQISDVINTSIEHAIRISKNPNTDVHFKTTTFWSILHGMVAMTLISAPGCPERAKRTLDDAIDGFLKALTL